MAAGFSYALGIRDLKRLIGVAWFLAFFGLVRLVRLLASFCACFGCALVMAWGLLTFELVDKVSELRSISARA